MNRSDGRVISSFTCCQTVYSAFTMCQKVSKKMKFAVYVMKHSPLALCAFHANTNFTKGASLSGLHVATTPVHFAGNVFSRPQQLGNEQLHQGTRRATGLCQIQGQLLPMDILLLQQTRSLCPSCHQQQVHNQS